MLGDSVCWWSDSPSIDPLLMEITHDPIRIIPKAIVSETRGWNFTVPLEASPSPAMPRGSRSEYNNFFCDPAF